MSSGFHRMGANVPGKNLGWDNSVLPPYGAMLPTYPAVALPSVSVAMPKMNYAQAKGSGYTGNECTYCNSMLMTISGHCEKCEDCGESSGCS